MSVEFGGNSLRYVKSSAWASTVLLAYDIFLTSDDEVRLVWRAPWGIPKALYFVSRYLGLATSLWGAFVQDIVATSTTICNDFHLITGLFIAIVSAAGDALLLVRVSALYHDKRWIRVTLLFIYGVLYFLQLCFCIASFFFEAGAFFQSASGTGCLSVTVPQSENYQLASITIAVYNSPISALNAIFFALTLFKLLPSSRHGSDSQTPLSTLLIRDGSLYSAMICSTLALSTGLALLNLPDLLLFGLIWFQAISPIASCRIFLNLREMSKSTHLDSARGARTGNLDRPEFNVNPSSDPSDGYSIPYDGGSPSDAYPLSTFAEAGRSRSVD